MPTSPLSHFATLFREFATRQTFAYAPATLYEPIRYAMTSPGKGVRPLLVLQAHALGAEDPTPALAAAYAVELFHSFTLVHDDIMDAADTRRGRPAVHKAFGEPTAILAGDAMLIHAYGYFLDYYSEALAVPLLRIFSSMAKELCAGQQRDMDMEADPGGGFDFADYLAMIGGKTGALITASLEIGGRIAQLGDADLARLSLGGDLAGRAFQILDDVLDTFSAGSITGKMDHGDIRRGKLSAPYLRALDVANLLDRSRLRQLYTLHVDERAAYVPEIVQIFEQYGVEQYLRDDAKSLTDQALAAFAELTGRPQAKQDLQHTILTLLGREY